MDKIIKCIVAAYNAMGEADLYPIKVSATEEQISDGQHCYAARHAAELKGYGRCYVVFDEDESAGHALMVLFDWNIVATVTV
jgi:hypothetical protein